MVGVAGKSKGCATCRKRKIKCDEAKPVCKRCERSALECGYERYPIFIHRNQDGYVKRAPLEEVKYSQHLQSIHSPEVEQARLLAWFHDVWTSSNPPHSALQSRIHWMSLVGREQPSHPALKQALLAMSFAKWNQIELNPELQQLGRSHYQNSLGLAQHALHNRADALSDDVLATTCVMTLYELVDPSCRLDSWLDHITGIGNMLCLRGPDHFSSAASRAILEHIRYIFMVRCLVTRTPCIFGSIQWLTSPWQASSKSIEQQVFDQGLRLTLLWKDCDLLPISKRGPSDSNALLPTAVDMFETLDTLIAYINSDVVERTGATSLLSITALGIQLGAASSVQGLLISAPGLIVDECYTTHLVVKAQNISQARRQVARLILFSVEDRSEAKTRALEALRIWWSLRLAEEQFTSADSEYERCQALLSSLARCTSPFDTLLHLDSRHIASLVHRIDDAHVEEVAS